MKNILTLTVLMILIQSVGLISCTSKSERAQIRGTEYSGTFEPAKFIDPKISPVDDAEEMIKAKKLLKLELELFKAKRNAKLIRANTLKIDDDFFIRSKPKDDSSDIIYTLYYKSKYTKFWMYHSTLENLEKGGEAPIDILVVTLLSKWEKANGKIRKPFEWR